MQESIVFLLCVQCRRKESSRSLSHLLMSFLYTTVIRPVLEYASPLWHPTLTKSQTERLEAG